MSQRTARPNGQARRKPGNRRPVLTPPFPRRPKGGYATIYADPPWQFKNTASRGAAANHYPTLSVQQLCDLPVADLAAQNSHL